VMPAEDQLKAFGAATASSGAVALFHIVGVTPEAPTVEAAFQDRPVTEEHIVTLDQLREIRRGLTTALGTKLDMVVLGSPHFSVAEFQQLAPLVTGRRRHAEVEFLVTTSRIMSALACEKGALAPVEAFGARLTVDTCILATPMLPKSVQVLMTNSAKYAYYAPGLLATQVVFGSMADCVRSAIEGRVVRDETLWQA
jgi:predicted aconitase